MLSSQLQLNMSGPEVTELQKFLMSQGYTVTTSGQPTGFFGPLTLAAVKAYQEDQGIATVGNPGYGRVGPITLNSIRTAQGVPPTDSVSGSTTPIISGSKDKTTYGSAGTDAATYIKNADPKFTAADNMVQNHIQTNIIGGEAATKLLSPAAPLPGTPEYDKWLEGFEEAAYDIANMQAQASNEQEKAYADEQWQNLKDSYEENLGFSLSNNAMAAYNQVNALRQNMAQRGISGSGIEQQSIQDYLKQIRIQDEQNRKTTARNLASAEAQHYVTAGTPEEIQKLIEEDKAAGLPPEEWRATKWGLIPSAETAQAFSVEELKKKFPNMSDQEIADARSTMFDKYGNFLSSTLATLNTKMLENLTNKKSVQQSEGLVKADFADQQAQQKYTPSSTTGGIGGTSNVFSKDNASTTPTEGTTTTSSSGTPSKPGVLTQDQINAIAKQNADYYTANPTVKPAGYTPYVAPKTATTGLAAASTAAQNISSNLSGAPKTGTTTPTTTTTKTSSTLTPPASTAAPKSSIMPSSIVDYMKAQNLDSSYANRSKLATQYNIKNYTGTADQNVELLGKIYKPPIQ